MVTLGVVHGDTVRAAHTQRQPIVRRRYNNNTAFKTSTQSDKILDGAARRHEQTFEKFRTVFHFSMVFGIKHSSISSGEFQNLSVFSSIRLSSSTSRRLRARHYGSMN